MNYHVHVYFEDATEAIASALRAQVETHPDALALGRFHSEPVGPHPTRQFQILVAEVALEGFLVWLDGERHDLSVLIHSDIEDDLLSHTTLARWLGDPHVLRLDRFR